MKRRGRPRGHELTTIGLPAKKAKKDMDKKPRSFNRLHVSRKEEGNLNSNRTTIDVVGVALAL